MGGSKQYGLMDAYGTRTLDASARARASAFRKAAVVRAEPDARGFITETRRPCRTSAFTRETETRVLPTPVSVPVIKRAWEVFALTGYPLVRGGLVPRV